MALEQLQEEGWPARDFDEPARAYLLAESRQRIQEQLAQIGAQDVKIAALFTASAALFAVSGLTGELRPALSVHAFLTYATFLATLISWLLLGRAYWTRTVGVGVDPRVFREHYRSASEQELRDVALELAVEDFGLNQGAIQSKARWLRFAFVAIAAQLLLLFASVLAHSVEDQSTSNPIEVQGSIAQQSSAPSLEGSR